MEGRYVTVHLPDGSTSVNAPLKIEASDIGGVLYLNAYVTVDSAKYNAEVGESLTTATSLFRWIADQIINSLGPCKRQCRYCKDVGYTSKGPCNCPRGVDLQITLHQSGWRHPSEPCPRCHGKKFVF